MKYRVLIVGKSRCKWSNTAVADYTKRLSKMGGVTEEHVKLAPFTGDVQAVRDEEAKRLLKAVRAGDFVIALDERGSAPDTQEFANLVDTARQRGQVVFIIGGAYGLGEEVRQRANEVVRLSSLVLNHEVARVVLYEQLYRALTVINGIPYHH